jgi:hypothetical protein
VSALEHQDLEQLIAAHQGRLRHLELTKARYGDDTAPQILDEIERIKQKLIDLGVAVVDNTNRELYLLMHAHYQQLDSRIYRFEHQMTRFEGHVNDILKAFNQLLAELAVLGLRNQPPPPPPPPRRKAARDNGA